MLVSDRTWASNISLDYRYLVIAPFDNLLAFSCKGITFTGDTPIFATGKNSVSVENGTREERETEMANVRCQVFCSHVQIPQELENQQRPCGKCLATLILAQQGVEYH